MFTISATEAKNRLGDVFEAIKSGSVAIEKNGKPAALILEWQRGKRLLLNAYSSGQGGLSTSEAIDLLGFENNFELLAEMGRLGLPLPSATARQRAAMKKGIVDFLKEEVRG